MLYEAAEECSYVNSKKVHEILLLEKPPFKKTTGQASGNLTSRHIVRLAAALPVDKMAEIAEGYMDIDGETIRNMKVKNKDDDDAFSREIIIHWTKNNPEDQVQVDIIYFSIKV